MSTTPGLLVSVRAADEVAAALDGGADIIDVKEPAKGPLAPAVTGSPVDPHTLAEDSDAPSGPGKPGAVWVRGYWHWDGVTYVWQRGRWDR